MHPTPGPWTWMGQGQHEVMLATTHSGRRFVMGFARYGLNRAQPTFQVDGRMVPASELFKFEVGDRSITGMTAAKADSSVYRYDVSDIDHPDARLIASAPDLLAALQEISGLPPERSDEAVGIANRTLRKVRAV